MAPPPGRASRTGRLMGKRGRRRGAEALSAPESSYTGPAGDVLVLRGAMTPRHPARSTPSAAAGSPLSREDAWQRAVELLFERLAVRWEIAGTEPITRQKELLGRYRFASADERRWIRDVLREHLAEHFPGRGATVTGPDPDAFARLLCGYCLDGAGRPAGRGPLRARSRPRSSWRVQRELLEREAWPLLRTELPGQSEGWWAAARDAQLDAFAPAELLEAEATQASLVIQAPENTRALAGVGRRTAWPAPPAPAARCARPACAAAGAAPSGRPRPPPSRPAWGPRSSPPSSAAPPSSTRTTPSPPGRELSTRQAALIARLAGASEIHIEAEGTDLRLRVEGRTWVNSDGRRNMPSGEVFTGPHEDSAEGTLRVSIPSSPRGVAVEGVELVFREGRVVDARAGVGEDYLLRHARHGPRRAAARRARHRHQRRASTGRSGRSCSTRRSAAPSTSRSARRIPRRAGRTTARCTGT